MPRSVVSGAGLCGAVRGWVSCVVRSTHMPRPGWCGGGAGWCCVVWLAESTVARWCCQYFEVDGEAYEFAGAFGAYSVECSVCFFDEFGVEDFFFSARFRFDACGVGCVDVCVHIYSLTHITIFRNFATNN